MGTNSASFAVPASVKAIQSEGSTGFASCNSLNLKSSPFIPAWSQFLSERHFQQETQIRRARGPSWYSLVCDHR